MRFFVAPMEGITTFTFRNLHHRMFPGADAYFAPFIQPKQTRVLETSELKNIDPENNRDLELIPQIMANRHDLFLWAAEELMARGYRHLNLNLGCPRSTIVSKGKGAGMLADLEGLRGFLDAIFDAAERMHLAISIKSRLGVDDFESATAIMSLYNDYPIETIVIHPRTRRDMYRNAPNWDVFEACLGVTKHRVCYNGNLFCVADYRRFVARFSHFECIEAVMPARGIVANPAWIREVLGGKKLDFREFRAWHDALFSAYDALRYGPSALLHRMKELWFYWAALFPESPKVVHRLRIAQTVEDYVVLSKRFFDNKTRVHTEIGQDAWN